MGTSAPALNSPVCVTGTGQFAHQSCISLAAHLDTEREVVVVGSSPERTARTTAAANAVAERRRRPITFTPFVAGVTDNERTATMLAERDIGVLLQCRSFYSTTARSDGPSQPAARFGDSLQLQAEPVLDLWNELSVRGWGGHIFNACYPDAVNALLRQSGAPVVAGLGNAAGMHRAASVWAGTEVVMLVGHLHMHEIAAGEPEARLWVEGAETATAGDALAAFRGLDRAERNARAAAETGPILAAYLDDIELHTALSGPDGLPGGYPTRITRGSVEVTLPPSVTFSEALAWNVDVLTCEGVDVADDGEVQLDPNVAGRPDVPLQTAVTMAHTGQSIQAVPGGSARYD